MAQQKVTTSTPPSTTSSSEETALVKKKSTNYLDYHSSRKDFIAKAFVPEGQPTLHLDRIVQIIDDYCFYSDMKPPRSLSQDFDQIGRYILQWASDETQLLLSRGNCREDVEATHGYSRAAQRHVRILADGLLGGTHESRQTPLCKELMALGGSSTKAEQVDAVVRPLTALYYKAGNCHEYAMVALQCIMAGTKALNIDIIRDACIYNIKAPSASGKPNGGSHAFLVIQMKGINDVLICDPWNKLVGTLKELEKQSGFLLPGSVYRSKTETYVPTGSLGILKKLSDSGIDVFELLKVWRTGSAAPKSAENLMNVIKQKCSRFESLDTTGEEVVSKEIGDKPEWLYSSKTVPKSQEPPTKDKAAAPAEPQATSPKVTSSS